MATRQASQAVLEVLTVAIPEMIGGSADLTGSNNTKTAALSPITASDFSGRYVYYGAREHGMAAAMNGLALHGGIIPYGGTFLVFTDYCRPSIRLSALMGQRVIYVMTHDSIGLGEDGPTHQPVEHLAALRAMPNLLVMRPCDTIETAECWTIAVARKEPPLGPGVNPPGPADVAHDSYGRKPMLEGRLCCCRIQWETAGNIDRDRFRGFVAFEARAKLEADGIATAVVSLPCWALFDAQPEEYGSRFR